VGIESPQLDILKIEVNPMVRLHIYYDVWPNCSRMEISFHSISVRIERTDKDHEWTVLVPKWGKFHTTLDPVDHKRFLIDFALGKIGYFKLRAGLAIDCEKYTWNPEEELQEV